MPTVFIPTVLRPYAGGLERIDVSGRTLRQVFEQLEAKCPGIKAQIVDEDGIRPGIAISVDGDVTGFGLTQSVEEDSEVHILPAIGGGS